MGTAPNNVDMPPTLFGMADDDTLVSGHAEMTFQGVDGFDPPRVVQGEGLVGGEADAGMIEGAAAAGAECDCTHFK